MKTTEGRRKAAYSQVKGKRLHWPEGRWELSVGISGILRIGKK